MITTQKPPSAAEAEMKVVAEEGRRDRLGRRRVPAQHRAQLVAEYLSSGLSQAAFARRAGMRYPTFAHWVQQARRAARALPGPDRHPDVPRFAELRLGADRPAPVAAPELSVSLRGGLVARGRDAAALAAVVRALWTQA
jgi:transposase-like protein